MALVPQAVTPRLRSRGFGTVYMPNQRNRTSEPWDQIVYTDTGAVNEIGAGDDATLSFSLLGEASLKGYCYKLRQIHVQIDEDAAGTNGWFGNVYQCGVSLSPQENVTTMYWPLISGTTGERDTSVSDGTVTCTIGQSRGYNAGNTGNDSSLSPAVMDVRDLIVFPENNQVQFQMANTTPSTGPWVYRFFAVFDQFTLEQANHSPLFWQFPVT